MTSERGANLLTLPVGSRDHVRGQASATVTLVQYGDYECLDCGQAYLALREIEEPLGSRLRFVFRHLPLIKIHPQAQHAAEAAEAAAAQNRFWEMHDKLFTHQRALESGYLVEYAAELGLNASRFLREMAAHTHAGRVHEDLVSGTKSGVHNTPAFFINGVRHEGAYNLPTLLAAIEQKALEQETEALLSF